jgi:hypothetical protein
MIETITTSTFYLEFKENNENDMAAHVLVVFWSVFYSSQSPYLSELDFSNSPV